MILPFIPTVNIFFPYLFIYLFILQLRSPLGIVKAADKKEVDKLTGMLY
jgi:hypothetical protein